MTERQTPRLVTGVDGCRGGWLVVRAQTGRRLRIEDISVVPAFADVLRRTRRCYAIAVDIPIGLTDGPPRAADIEARRLLGRPRASSVFPAPVRAALTASSYDDACARSLAACGRKLSKQTYYILAKIREADAAMTPSRQRRVVEAHPEVSFRALNGGHALANNKRSLAGRDKRVRLLSRVFADVSAPRPPPGAAWDDLYDALVLAWTAARLARGEAQRVPPKPHRDARGLRMEIVW